MIDLRQPITHVPDEEALAIWELDLARRLVQLGRNSGEELVGQWRDALQRFRGEPSSDLIDPFGEEDSSPGVVA